MAGKDQALSRAGLLYPKAERVRSPLFKRLPFFDPRDKLQVKYEMLRGHEVDGLSVTEAADQFAYTRQGFYQVQRAFEEEGMAGLIEKKRGRRGPVKCTPEVLKFVLGKKQADPELTGRDLTVLLREQQGVAVHRRTIEKIVSGFPPRPRKKNRRKPDEARRRNDPPFSFWQVGGEVQSWYEALRAETLGEDPVQAVDPALRERFTGTGLMALFSGDALRNAGWMPPFRIEREGARKDSCSLRTLVEIYELILDRSLGKRPSNSRRISRETCPSTRGDLRQSFFAPPAKAGNRREPACRLA